MSTLSLALRNLLRNRRRSLTTLMAMIIGAVCILLFGGYSRNISRGLQTNFVRSGGHLQIQHQDYFLYGAGDPLDYGIADYPHVIQVIQSDPVLASMVKVVTPTLQVGGIAGNYSAGVSRTIIAHGTVVDDQNRMRQWNDYGFPNDYKPLPLTNTPSDSAIVGSGLARVLHVCTQLHVPNCHAAIRTARDAGESMPDDIVALKTAAGLPSVDVDHANNPGIELLAATAHGAPNVAELTVLKAEDQGVKELDDMYVGLHLNAAQRLVYGTGSPEVTAIEVQLAHTGQIPLARERIGQLLQGPLRGEPLEIQDFATLNPFYGQTLAMFSAIFGFIAMLIAAIVLFTVGNTMSMAVVERTVEIGTLRAMGLRRAGIRKLFLCEGFLLGLLGAALGVVIALALAAAVNHGGLTWTPPGRVNPVPLQIRVWGETSLIAGTAVGLLLVALASAWWPARRAARLNVVEALRHV